MKLIPVDDTQTDTPARVGIKRGTGMHDPLVVDKNSRAGLEPSYNRELGAKDFDRIYLSNFDD